MPRSDVPRVLVVDDMPEIRETVRIVLEALGGWEVITACNGKEGVDRAIAERPDMVLMDFQMPVMDGPTAFRTMREYAEVRDIPVVFLTSVTDIQALMPLLDQGARGVLHKPFDPMFLISEVARVLEVPLPAGVKR